MMYSIVARPSFAEQKRRSTELNLLVYGCEARFSAST
jgi:hypothetical protein